MAKAKNRAQGRVAASASKSAVKQKRSQWLTSGLAIAALGIVVAAIVVGITVGSGSSAGDRAPDFSFTLFQGGAELGGRDLDIHQLEGKPVILNFWAGLCPPCRAEMPDLQAFHDEYKDDVTLIGVDIGKFMGLGSQRDAENLLRELNITYPAGFTDDRSVVRDYQVLGMPTTVFINADGTIFEKWTGALNRRILQQKLQQMQALQ